MHIKHVAGPHKCFFPLLFLATGSFHVGYLPQQDECPRNKSIPLSPLQALSGRHLGPAACVAFPQGPSRGLPQQTPWSWAAPSCLGKRSLLCEALENSDQLGVWLVSAPLVRPNVGVSVEAAMAYKRDTWIPRLFPSAAPIPGCTPPRPTALNELEYVRFSSQWMSIAGHARHDIL